MRVLADTRQRLSVGQLGSLSFEGDPDEVRLTDLATGEPVEAERAGDGSFSVPTPGVPRLISAEWGSGGDLLSAELDVVARRYCSAEDVLGWRRDEYQLDREYDPGSEDVQRAVDAAEATIEAACLRALQPVMRLGYADRGCRTRVLVAGDGGAYDPCLSSVVSARGPDGSPADVRQARPGSPYLDVSGLAFGDAATVAYVTGSERVPPEMHDAVCALAAWSLSHHGAPDNATSATTDVGVINYVVAGVSGAATSLPEVNALIERYALSGCDVG